MPKDRARQLRLTLDDVVAGVSAGLDPLELLDDITTVERFAVEFATERVASARAAGATWMTLRDVSVSAGRPRTSASAPAAEVCTSPCASSDDPHEHPCRRPLCQPWSRHWSTSACRYTPQTPDRLLASLGLLQRQTFLKVHTCSQSRTPAPTTG